MKPLTEEDARVLISVRIPLALRNVIVERATSRDISMNELVVETLKREFYGE